MAVVSHAADQLGTAFTYQGKLASGGQAAKGIYDFRFRIYDLDSGGSPLSAAIEISGLTVSNGLFTASLDFGPGIFNGDARWLEIGVRTHRSPDPYHTLPLRQRLTPAPQALWAQNAGTAAEAVRANAGAVSAGSLSTPSPPSTSQVLTYDGTSLAWMSLGSQGTGAWNLTGNAGTAPGASFLGTTDDRALELKVNRQRAFRLEPNQDVAGKSNMVNVLAGSPSNVIAAGVSGATIAGGGAGYSIDRPRPNRVMADAGTIGGGLGHEIQNVAAAGSVGGGMNNTVIGPFSTIAGGYYNRADGPSATVAGGQLNEAAGSYSTVAGGLGNSAVWDSTVVAGGSANSALNTHATIGGGDSNTNSGAYGTIPGGSLNLVTGDYGFAAGRRAKATHEGALVWADATDADFVSTSTNQFLVRASGGVGIGTNDPRAALHVAGWVKADGFNGRVPADNLTGEIAPANIGAGTITGAMLAPASVSSPALADGAVTLDKVSTQMGNVSLLATLKKRVPVTGDRFGSAVAAVGSDRVLIGASQEDLAGKINAGAAYLFNLNELGNINGPLETTFVSPSVQNSERFGQAVAAVGTDKVVIGAYGHRSGTIQEGAAYLFDLGGTWLRTFTNPNPQHGDFFGESVAGVGADKVLVGASGYSSGTYIKAGVAYLFSLDGTLLTTFDNPTPQVVGLFGFSVAAVGTDKVLIGALGNVTPAGVVYLFSTAGTLLTTFDNPSPGQDDCFGRSVAAVGPDKVLIGAYIDHSAGVPGGAAYLYSTDGTLLTRFDNPTPEYGDDFGYSVAAVGTDKVLIGAKGTGALLAGAAYLFGTDGTLLKTFTNPTPVYSDYFGGALAAVGADKVVIAAENDSNGAGAAYLYSPARYLPGLAGDGARAGSITHESLASDVGVWTRSGANLFHLGGKVGVGTDTLQARLHVASGGSEPQLRLDQTVPGDWARLRLGGAGPADHHWILSVRDANEPGINFFNGTGNAMSVSYFGTVTALAFNPTSDRNVKEDFVPSNPRDVLEKLVGLPVQSWAFKSEPGARHLGPVAQDFHAAFGLGADDKHIATMDADGVALAAIQGLNQKVEAGTHESEARSRRLEAENTALKQELTALRQRLEKLEALLDTASGPSQ